MIENISFFRRRKSAYRRELNTYLKEKGLLKRIGSDKGGHWEIVELDNNQKTGGEQNG